MSYPLIAIVGAPNVGKSTLFNRLVGRRRSIVTDEPGVTRDRLYGEVRDTPRPFRIVDTGGLAPRTPFPLAEEIEKQAMAALEEAVAVLFVVDARAGPTALDREIGSMLRKHGKPVLLVAGKLDGPSLEHLVHDLHTLGMGDALPVSAEHGRGIEELLDRITEVLEEIGTEEDEAEDASRPIRIALVGRPNVGKSSLLNRLAGEERVMVSEQPGTTRDAVDTLLRRDDRSYLLVDTAGIRRKGRKRATAETLSVVLARKSIGRAHVVVLVLDAVEGCVAQDAHIAGYAVQALRPLVLVVNKWDLVEGREEAARVWGEEVRRRLAFAKQAPMVLVSARTNLRVNRILDQVGEVHAAAGRRVPTPELNRWLQGVARGEQASPARGRSVHLLYVTQTGTHPPRFVFFCNFPERVHFSLRRFLDNDLRKRFGFGSSPISLQFRRRRSRRMHR